MLALAAAAHAEEPYQLPGLTVTDEAEDKVFFKVDPGETNITAPDAATLLKRVPGANVNRNGPLSGITQYRGMFGTRMNVSVDGTYIGSGGPNWMDPPLHYAPAVLLDSLKLQRGIPSVSVGNETIGGYVAAQSKTGEFTDSDDVAFQGRAVANAHSVDEGYSVGGLMGLANKRHRVHVGASRDKGDDYDFGSGTVKASEYERNVFDAGYGFRHDVHQVGLGVRRNETDDTGTPALPMDIDYFNTSMGRIAYDTAWRDVQIRTKLYASDVNHRMTNFHLRPAPPDPARWRFSDAESDTFGYDLKALTPVWRGQLGVGVDGHSADHDADIFNPNNPAFFVNNFRRVERDVDGMFAEWNGRLAAKWGSEIGLRYTRVESDAGDVDGTPAQMMMGPRTLRDRFNASDRNKTDNNIDWVAKVFYDLRPDMRVELGAARKTRSPAYQERYLWLPLQATAGLADGKNYVGDVNLDPEVSHQVELGLDWRTSGFYLAPRVFYRDVDDYIQGTPSTDPVVIMISTTNGDPNPLQFSNVDAEIYGADVELGAHLPWHLRVDGILSYVRGKRDDINDNLYRIAPPNATLGLTYERPRWSVTAEGVFYAKQDNVSETNEEEETDSYELLNLFGNYALKESGPVRANLSAGVDNVFDNTYTNHLAGINRVRDSDVTVGEKLPGHGRNFFARVSVDW